MELKGILQHPSLPERAQLMKGCQTHPQRFTCLLWQEHSEGSLGKGKAIRLFILPGAFPCRQVKRSLSSNILFITGYCIKVWSRGSDFPPFPHQPCATSEELRWKPKRALPELPGSALLIKQAELHTWPHLQQPDTQQKSNISFPAVVPWFARACQSCAFCVLWADRERLFMWSPLQAFQTARIQTSCFSARTAWARSSARNNVHSAIVVHRAQDFFIWPQKPHLSPTSLRYLTIPSQITKPWIPTTACLWKGFVFCVLAIY